MSIPKAIFLDTSVIEAQRFNFESPVMVAFADACRKYQRIVLLPEVTRAEIERHITKEVSVAVAEITRVVSGTAIMRSWSLFPKPMTGLKDAAVAHALGVFRKYVREVHALDLRYETSTLRALMDRYDARRTPFDQEGRKAGQFPDAVAGLLLEAYARQERCEVAVVSADGDFKRISQRSTSLLHFRSVAAVTARLVSADEEVVRCKAALDADREAIVAAIDSDVGAHARVYGDFIQVRDTSATSTNVGEVNVVAIGQDECLIAFDGTVRLKIDYEAIYPDSAGDTQIDRRDEEVDFNFDGTAKVMFETDGRVAEVHGILLDTYEFEFMPSIFRWK